MFKKIVVGTDGSDLGNKALHQAVDLAKLTEAHIFVVTATDPVATGIGSGGFGTIDAGAIVAQLEETYAEQAKAILTAATNICKERGIPISTTHAPRHRPADAILEVAETEGADLIVMGSHGRRGLQRLLLGSQAAEVLSKATVPVLIAR